MCGRAVSPPSESGSSSHPAASAYPERRASWNVAPTDPAQVVYYDARDGAPLRGHALGLSVALVSSGTQEERCGA